MKKNNYQEEKIKKKKLKKETQQLVASLIFLGLALIIVLSFFNLAGPLGKILYSTGRFLFGWLYYLLPILFLIASIIFIGILKNHIYFNTFFGLLFFFLGLLGLSDLLEKKSAGFLGKIVGETEKILGFWGAFVFSLILSLIGLTIVFEISLKKPQRKKDIFFEKIEKEKIEKPEKVEIKSGLEIKEETKPKKEEEEKEETIKPSLKKLKPITNWIFPPLDLLEADSGQPSSGDIKNNLYIIKRTLANFGIPVEMDEVQVGPTVTRYTLKPAEGVKLSKIVALQNDLALALAAHPIRIEAPIPGKSLVGIEVPNKTKTLVRLKNLLQLEKFLEGGFLVFPLGRDVSGEPVFADLANMPHLLIAGSTGSGKSIAIHSLILSLLYKNTPETLRLLLIDPKRVELSIYNGLPHLISEVIINPKTTILALRWAVNEMDQRYSQLLETGSRDIMSYNQKMLKEKKTAMPYLVIIIDELADLMAAYGREVEASIIRLAQMARATGVHLIVSTQRPSVEVVTGLIKANITARIALQVASQVDSRTILDMAGAEKLLGRGDMLYLAAETSKPKRIQGVYVSEQEINRVVDFIIENNKDYQTFEKEKDFEKVLEEKFGGVSFEEEEDLEIDDLYPEAYRVVVEAGKASASFLQRRLRIGYARAARLLDLLEAKGIIGPADGAKPREVLIKSPTSRASEENEDKNNQN